MKQSEVEVFIDDIGKRIRELRKERNMTQLDLATISDIDERQVQRLERGHTSATLKTLLKITNGLNVNFLEFFEFINKTENKK
ncbi:helix-turn-helix domain-containing protein [Flavivirga eckloniae]|uniref:XRE family transcriptional regulator n=1 Tax=Flavivirga eckloniae TaxID=1803846 RepID=A0A2K9PPU6_9FLAO|nr:helix-turn-helix transcriptional regulator [Flavivirga eckloniae]AUP79091.1 XRE family transcriptional regulator [Flavivirga eckloniae]